MRAIVRLAPFICAFNTSSSAYAYIYLNAIKHALSPIFEAIFFVVDNVIHKQKKPGFASGL